MLGTASSFPSGHTVPFVASWSVVEMGASARSAPASAKTSSEVASSLLTRHSKSAAATRPCRVALDDETLFPASVANSMSGFRCRRHRR